MNDHKFGKLRLSVQGTNNGRGFDVLYDFPENYYFVEFTAKKEFYFIQPWMQFPSQEYTDECMRVSIELVRRFNEFQEFRDRVERQAKDIEFLVRDRDELRAQLRALQTPQVGDANE